MRGAAFEDPTTTEASVVFAVETAMLQRKSESGGSRATTLESLLRLVRVTTTGQVDSLPLEHLLLLRPADRFPAQHASLAMRASELQARALDYVDQQIVRAAIEERRAALRESLAPPETRARIANLGAEIKIGTPAEFGKLLADELAQWTAVVKAANIKVE